MVVKITEHALCYFLTLQDVLLLLFGRKGSRGRGYFQSIGTLQYAFFKHYHLTFINLIPELTPAGTDERASNVQEALCTL